MTIDITKIRPGDRVTLVPLEVRAVHPGAIRIWFSRFGDVAFDPDQIAAHHPAPRELKVGDKVRMGENPPGKVIGIDDGWIYVLWPHHSGAYPFRSCDLTLVEGGE